MKSEYDERIITVFSKIQRVVYYQCCVLISRRVKQLRKMFLLFQANYQLLMLSLLCEVNG